MATVWLWAGPSTVLGRNSEDLTSTKVECKDPSDSSACRLLACAQDVDGKPRRWAEWLVHRMWTASRAVGQRSVWGCKRGGQGCNETGPCGRGVWSDCVVPWVRWGWSGAGNAARERLRPPGRGCGTQSKLSTRVTQSELPPVLSSSLRSPASCSRKLRRS